MPLARLLNNMVHYRWQYDVFRILYTFHILRNIAFISNVALRKFMEEEVNKCAHRLLVVPKKLKYVEDFLARKQS